MGASIQDGFWVFMLITTKMTFKPNNNLAVVWIAKFSFLQTQPNILQLKKYFLSSSEL